MLVSKDVERNSKISILAFEVIKIILGALRKNRKL